LIYITPHVLSVFSFLQKQARFAQAEALPFLPASCTPFAALPTSHLPPLYHQASTNTRPPVNQVLLKLTKRLPAACTLPPGGPIHTPFPNDFQLSLNFFFNSLKAYLIVFTLIKIDKNDASTSYLGLLVGCLRLGSFVA